MYTTPTTTFTTQMICHNLYKTYNLISIPDQKKKKEKKSYVILLVGFKIVLIHFNNCFLAIRRLQASSKLLVNLQGLSNRKIKHNFLGTTGNGVGSDLSVKSLDSTALAAASI